MVNWPWYVPQFRDVAYDNIEVLKIADVEDEPVKIREYRDEANRPWWKFFDEYEYRLTTEDSKKHEWWKWFDDGTTAQEKKLLWKLDLLVTFYAFLGYWVKYIDSANLTNAYVSGLQEDIGMKGNDLINTQVIFSVGNIIFELPWMFFLPRIPINYVLFFCELGWGISTLLTHKVTNVAGLQAVRFFVGSFEAPYFPLIHYTFANWYRSTEISRRAGFFYFGNFLGVLTSGLLQSAAFDNLSGKNNLSGWQWMFIVDGIISIAVAFLGLLLLPGTPTKCYSIWLTDDEIKLARKRMSEEQVDVSPTVGSFFNKKTWKKILTSWHFWLLTGAQCSGFSTNTASSGSFALWLKSLNKYSVGKINNYTTVPPALGILYVFIICFGADVTRKRFLLCIFSYAMNIVSGAMLTVWDISDNAKWVAFCLAYFSWSQSSVFNPMVNDVLRQDQNLRSIEWMIIYILGLSSNTWISRLIWKTTESPAYHTGFLTATILSATCIAFLSVAYFFYKRDERNAALSNGIFLYNSQTDPLPEILETTDSDELKKTEVNIRSHDKTSDSE